jgi:hypothetical protein
MINKNDMDLKDLLAKSLKERELLLENNPGLQQSQERIDCLLLKAGSFNNRMSTLFYLMEANLYKLREQLELLDTTLKD